MAKPLVLGYQGIDVAVGLEKVDRAALYGYVDHEALDGDGRACTLATLAGDGHTVIGPGGTALATLSPAGLWREKAELAAIGPDGEALTPVASSFGAPVPLNEMATVDDVLAHPIRSVYALTPEGDVAELFAELAAGQIYKIPFSYRGGLEPDVGFLLANSAGAPFLVLGKPAKMTFVGLAQVAPAEPDAAGDDDDDDDLDFGMI